MPRILVLLIAVVVVLLAASQVGLPLLAERQAENRLEQGGGRAKVKVSAVPALRLLFGDGDRLEARGRGLRVDVSRGGGGLGQLDDFNEVSVRLTAMSAAPLDVRDFTLTRDSGSSPYRLRMTAVTTPRDVAAFFGSQAGGALGGLFGDLAAGSLPGAGNTRVPLTVTATVESRGGHPVVSAADGSVAGLPAGPLAQIVVAAVVARI